ncbi:hypothetical protein [Stenotrophomonas sp. PA-6-5C]|uniref:hypothetical protein n=1 Tax=Stenotrophomonas sp. PA-6-5C TaxID=2665487 RepID=UPI001F160735|nr:hypothetical protein [Stenotrophomonas sp. PA-6-5C]
MAVRQPLADLRGTAWVIGRNAIEGDQCRKIRALGRAYPKCWSLPGHRGRLRSSKDIIVARYQRSMRCFLL